MPKISDAKRGQNLQAEARALRPRPRPRPEIWGQGQGQGRGQLLDVEAKAEAKDKVINKMYQMMVDNTGEFISLWSKRHTLISYLSHSNYPLS